MNEKKRNSRKNRIKKEVKKLKNIFLSTKSNKSHVIEELINRASFLLILSEDMELDINGDELKVLTVNSNQEFIKSNPLLKDYRDTIKSYQTVLKQLCDLIKNEIPPDDEKKLDELEEFINIK